MANDPEHVKALIDKHQKIVDQKAEAERRTKEEIIPAATLMWRIHRRDKT